jgi:hydrogenase nickel incorporation protein HypA/HybF
MHELPVTEQLLKIVLDHARKAEAKRVLKVNLVIGELTSFIGDSIQFYFDMLSKETEAEGASLSISHIPAKATCKQCNREFHPEGMDWFCPVCGGPTEEVMGGREFYIESIEIE